MPTPHTSTGRPHRPAQGRDRGRSPPMATCAASAPLCLKTEPPTAHRQRSRRKLGDPLRPVANAPSPRPPRFASAPDGRDLSSNHSRRTRVLSGATRPRVLIATSDTTQSLDLRGDATSRLTGGPPCFAVLCACGSPSACLLAFPVYLTLPLTPSLTADLPRLLLFCLLRPCLLASCMSAVPSRGGAWNPGGVGTSTSMARLPPRGHTVPRAWACAPRVYVHALLTNAPPRASHVAGLGQPDYATSRASMRVRCALRARVRMRAHAWLGVRMGAARVESPCLPAPLSTSIRRLDGATARLEATRLVSLWNRTQNCSSVHSTESNARPCIEHPPTYLS